MFQYTELLIRIAYGYVKDLHAAEDIVQEVFIKFYHYQKNYEERGEAIKKSTEWGTMGGVFK